MANPTVIGSDGGAAQVALPTLELLQAVIPLNADGAVMGSADAPLEVNATFTPSGTQDVDIASIGGNAVTTTIPVSGTVTATGPLTDAQLRATAVPVSGPLTDAQIRATALPVSGPLTDAQLRASAPAVNLTQIAGAAPSASNALYARLSNGTAAIGTVNTPVPTAQGAPAGQELAQFLWTDGTSDGSGAGTVQLAGAFTSGSPRIVYWGPTTGQAAIIERLSISTIISSGSYTWAGLWGSGVAALTNGFQIQAASGATSGAGGLTLLQIPANSVLTGNYQFATLPGVRVTLLGTTTAVYEIDFVAAFGGGLVLEAGEILRILARDTTTGGNVTEVTARIAGRLFTL